MQFIDLVAQQKRIRPQIEARFKRILDHGQYILGPEITELEEKLAAFTSAPFAISVASGTDALLMPLMIERSAPATPCSHLRSPSSPQPRSLPSRGPRRCSSISIKRRSISIPASSRRRFCVCAKKKLTVRGIIPVDLFGQPADYQAIQAIADTYGCSCWKTLPRASAPVKKAKKRGRWLRSQAPAFSRPSLWAATVTAA